MEKPKLIAAIVGGVLAIAAAIAYTLFGVEADFKPIIDLMGK